MAKKHNDEAEDRALFKGMMKEHEAKEAAGESDGDEAPMRARTYGGPRMHAGHKPGHIPYGK